ncbi:MULTISPECIES: ABC transporter permease [Agrobacterium]|uniref:Inner membrane ABC transporter permease protein YdcU n=1 Tax=Agrobacterium rosae TaxID=1972867 RepID=A0A1R3TSN7_9HYPH|nr:MULTISPECIES: ABC transporter permease [Agrobacterium]SCX10850.1 Inner membrane ABC transporter permease protein YdcU [Agrobacterium sp. DSM 25558]SCX23001.1 Inner membrane ABC transporter permease protein YdcU [Agrobacterium rosae]
MQGLLRDRRVQLLVLLAPGVGYLIVFFGGPLLSALLGSFRLEDGSFTLSLYERIFTRPSMIRGLRTSIYYGVMPVIVSLVVSVPLALLISKSFIGRKLFSGLYKLPMAVPGIIVGLMIIVVFERGGFMDRLVAPLGLELPKLVRDDWGIGVILASVWKQIPFMTLIITTAFAAIPEDIRYASRTMGASRFKTFIFVEVPLAMPGITAAILLTFIGSMGSYAIPDIVGPPTARPLSVLMVQEFNQGRFNQVYAMGMVLSLFAVVVLLAYYTLTSRIGQTRENAQ